MRRAALRLAGLLAVVAGLGLAAPPLHAQRSLVFEELHADIEVRPDGSLLVTETLRPRFSGEWNGILRVLRLDAPADYGADYRLHAELLSATDGQGRALRHESTLLDRGRRQFKVWVPDARDRTATVRLTYQVRNALGHFAPDTASGTGPWDELYWQVTGTEWEVPILRASAAVRLPSGAAPFQSAAYVGGAASRRQAPVRETAAGIEVPPVGPLRPGEGLTVGVGWPAGFVPRPTAAERRALGRDAPSPLAVLPLLLPLLVGWLAHRTWKRRGKDPAERAITVRWEPPEALRPAEAGTLVDHSPGMHDIVSTLVDLAVRGWIVIEEREKKGFLATGSDYAFHLMKPRGEWGALRDHERLFLDGLFEAERSDSLAAALGRGGLGGLFRELTDDDDVAAPDGAVATVRLSDLKNEFYRKIPKIRGAIFNELVREGHYLRRPDNVRARWIMYAAAALAAGFAGMTAIGTGSATGQLAGGALLVAGGVSAVILGVYGWLMPARTEKGARTREAALGFGRFLERVESPRYRRMITSPAQFEQYLPFAMAFQCEEKWAAAFDDLLTEPPNWYRGRHGLFTPTAFVSDLGGLASAASSTLSSSPSSSGSGGGGSVGGGGGGGGGGGF